MILGGPEDQLQLTKNTQPAILTVSYSIFKVLKDEFNFDFSSEGGFGKFLKTLHCNDDFGYKTTHKVSPIAKKYNFAPLFTKIFFT